MRSTTMESAQSKNRYDILEEIGSGGMGVVYKAYDNKLQRFVALKVVDTHHNLKRFAAEYTAMANLNHPHIVQFYECGESPQPFLTMEYIDGQTLADYDKSKINRRFIIDLFIKVCEALAYAHSKDIIHRDLKPSNIMIDNDGQPKIMDFGLVKIMEGESISVQGEILGTPTYMSPEQVKGKCTKKSDIYSIGATLYELLTHKKIYEGSVQYIVVQILRGTPIPPRQISPKICPYLEAICMKCISRNPRKRYRNFKELAQEFKNLQNNKPILAKKYTSWDATRTLIVRHKVIFTSILMVFIILTSSVFILLHVIAAKEYANTQLQENIKSKEELIASTFEFFDRIQDSKYADLFFDKKLIEPFRKVFSKPENLKLISNHVFFTGVIFDLASDKKSLEVAVQHYNEQIEKYPNEAVLYNNRGNVFFKLGLYAKALEDYNKAITLNISHYSAYNNRGNVHFFFRRYEVALADYKTAIRLNSNDAKAHYGMGKTYVMMNNLPLAKKYFSSALAINPNYTEAFSWRGYVHHKLSEFSAALNDYNETILRNSSHVVTLFYRGELYVLLGRFKLAEKDFSAAIAVDHQYASAYASRGNVRYIQQKFTQAKHDLDKALMIDSKHKKAYYYRGILYEKQNKLRLALQDWENAIHYGMPESELRSLIDKAKKMLKQE